MVSFKHAFVNPKPDGADTTITRPSDWNAEHEVLMGAPGLLGRLLDPGAVEELSFPALSVIFQPRDPQLDAWASLDPATFLTEAEAAGIYHLLNAPLFVTGSTSFFIGSSFTSTNADANTGPFLVLDRASPSPAVNDFIGSLLFRGRDSANNVTDYAEILARILDPVNGSEDAEVQVYSQQAGVRTLAMTIKPGLVEIHGALGNCTLAILGPGNGSIEFGRVDGVASTPFLDFHSGAVAVDYDARIIASGGTGATGGGALTLTAATLNGGPVGAATAIKRAGKETVWVPASAIFSTGVGGPSTGTLNVSGANFPYLAFDPSVNEFGFFSVGAPKSWDLGPLSFRFYWAHPAAVTNFGVAWVAAVASFGDNEALTNSYAAHAAVLDTGGVTSNLYITSESATVDPGNVQATNDLLPCFVARDAVNGSDNLAVDAFLLGVMVHFTTNAGNDL